MKKRKAKVYNSRNVEATSGKYRPSMAMVAAVKGYNCILCVPNKISKEKIQLMEAMGAKVKSP
ncbi:MAG: hypothetical protein R2806_23750 [Saprospiraceae bacterium]